MKLKPISQWQWIPWEIRWVICTDPWDSFDIWYENYPKGDEEEENLLLAIDLYSRWNPSVYARLFIFLWHLASRMRNGSDA